MSQRASELARLAVTERRRCSKRMRRSGKHFFGNGSVRGGARSPPLNFQRGGSGIWRCLCPGSRGGFFTAQTLADDLEKRFPEDTSVRFNYLPTLRALVALNRSEPSKAIEVLERAPYELGSPPAVLVFLGSSRPMCVAKPTWVHIGVPKPPRSSRKFSTIEGLLSAIP